MSTHTIPVFIPVATLEALAQFTDNWWSDTFAMEPFILEAIDNYIKASPAQEQAQPAAPSEAGYQWKQVFLPEGTRLRASFAGQPYYATVEGAQIMYDEHAVSPSCFANLHGSGNRNAWKAIWLHLPGSEEWLLADVVRSTRKAAIVRLLGIAVQADGPPQEQRKRLQTRQARSRAVDASPAERAQQPRSRPRLANSLPAATSSKGTQRSSGSGRRRKRRHAKHHPGSP